MMRYERCSVQSLSTRSGVDGAHATRTGLPDCARPDGDLDAHTALPDPRREVDELERFIQQKYAEARGGTVPEEPATAEADEAAQDAEGTAPAGGGRRRR
jgi:hypothetical protein